jgi:hypothetical protein
MKKFIVLMLIALMNLTATAQVSVSKMFSSLYIVDSNGQVLVDGVLNDYASIYSNYVDIYDGWKMINPGTNWAINRNDTLLSVERRDSLKTADTVYFKVWNLLNVNYRLKFKMVNFTNPLLTAYLYDSYLHTETPISTAQNDTTFYDFNIISGGNISNRFKVIFKVSVVLPVTFTNINATRAGNTVSVKWNIENELNVSKYLVQRSSDGVNFETVGSVSANSINSYSYSYTETLKTKLYYRVQSVDVDGKTQLTNIVSVKAETVNFNVYPTLIENHKVTVEFAGNEKHNLILIATNGAQYQLGVISNTTSINLPNVASGMYYLVSVSNNEKTTTKVIIK